MGSNRGAARRQSPNFRGVFMHLNVHFCVPKWFRPSALLELLLEQRQLLFEIRELRTQCGDFFFELCKTLRMRAR
jgi:hypothetical protein